MHRVQDRKRFFPHIGQVLLGLTMAILALGLDGCKASLVPARQGLLMRNIDLPVRQLVFPSGLRIVAERDPRTPVVGLFLVVGAGSSSDPPGKEGLAHYVEHLAFRSRPFAKSSFRRLLERADAGEWNAYTSLDATVYHEVGPASGLAELLRLEGARMLAPVVNLAPETLDVELDVVRSELRERNETGFVGEVLGSLQRAVFPTGHAYARPVAGTHESLTSIRVEDVKAFLTANYQPGNMTLGIVGDIDLTTIQSIVEQSLPKDLFSAPSSEPQVRAHARGPIPERAPEPPAPPPQILSRGEASVATPEIWIGWSLPRAFDADTHLARMAVDAAGNALSRARWLRSGLDRDIAMVDTHLVSGKDASMLACRVVLEHGAHPEKSLEHVLNNIHEVWHGAQTGPQIGEVVFGSQQRGAVVDLLLETEDLVEHGTTRALTTHFTQNPLTYTRSIEKVMRLKQEPFLDYAEKYLARDRARAVYFTPAPGGARANARPIGAHTLGEEDPMPLRVDAARLTAIAPGPRVSGYREFTLANGLQVIVGARPGWPSASVGLLVRGGMGAASSPAAVGLAMILAENPRWSKHGGSYQFGAGLQRSLDLEKTVYRIDGASGNVGMMIAILAETVPSFELHGGSMRTFRDHFVSYLRLAEQKPEVVANRAHFQRLFGGHAYSRAFPTADDLANSSVGAAEDWFDETHVPNNSTLVVVGEVDPDEVVRIVQSELGDWKRSATAAPLPPAYEPAGAPSSIKVLVTERPAATQTQLRLGCSLPAARIVSTPLHHEVTAKLVESRLSEGLRERTGTTYGVHAASRTLRGGTSFLEVGGAVERDKLAMALTSMRDALRNIGETPPQENELAWAKLRAARAHATTYVTNQGIASAILTTTNRGFAIGSLDAEAMDIAATSVKNVQDAIHACTSGGLILSLVGDAPSIHAALKEAGLR